MDHHRVVFFQGHILDFIDVPAVLVIDCVNASAIGQLLPDREVVPREKIFFQIVPARQLLGRLLLLFHSLRIDGPLQHLHIGPVLFGNSEGKVRKGPPLAVLPFQHLPLAVQDLVVCVFQRGIPIQIAVVLLHQGLVRLGSGFRRVSFRKATGDPVQAFFPVLQVPLGGRQILPQIQCRQNHQAPAGKSGAHQAQGAQDNGQPLENTVIFHFFSPSSL